jgi:hypothetical protein
MKVRHSFARALGIAVLVGCALTGSTKEFYVAPGGDDAAPGTKEQPFRTLEKARDSIRAFKKSNGAKLEPFTVFLRGGTYVLDRTFILAPQDSGSLGAPVCYRNFPEETAKLIGSREIKDWRPLTEEPSFVAAAAKGKLWVADIPKGWRFHYLFVDGKRAERSRLNHDFWRRWPKDFTNGQPDSAGQIVTFDRKELLRNLPTNGDLEMVAILAQYGVMGNGVLTFLDPQSGEARWNSRQLNLRSSRTASERGYNLENALAFIDRPGEWAVDSAAGKVFYWPPDGSMTTHRVVAPKLYELVRLQGAEENGPWVHDVEFRGLTFACTDRLPENEWPHDWLKRQWEHPDAAVYFQGTHDCALVNCRILDAGASGLTLSHYAQHVRVEGNEIGWTGSDGVLLEGYGPGTNDVNRFNVITRNCIHDQGLGNYWHSPGIQIWQSGHNEITLNLIQRSAYNGISSTGADPARLSDPAYFFQSSAPAGQFDPWNMFNIRSQDFPQEVQEKIRRRQFAFNRETMKPYIHSRENRIEHNLLVEPETMLAEGGAIYAWWFGTGNVWHANAIFKSAGMPSSSVLALDDGGEFATVTDNVMWVEGKILNGVGARPTERGNTISGNVRVCYQPEFAATQREHEGRWWTNVPSREPLDRLVKEITDEVQSRGGWLGSPKRGMPTSGEMLHHSAEEELPPDAHVTIEP